MSDLKAYLDRLVEVYKNLNDAALQTSKPGHEADYSATHNQLIVLKENGFLMISAVKDLCDHDGPIDEMGQNELLLMVDEFFELAEESLLPPSNQ